MISYIALTCFIDTTRSITSPAHEWMTTGKKIEITQALPKWAECSNVLTDNSTGIKVTETWYVKINNFTNLLISLCVTTGLDLKIFTDTFVSKDEYYLAAERLGHDQNKYYENQWRVAAALPCSNMNNNTSTARLQVYLGTVPIRDCIWAIFSELDESYEWDYS